MSNTIWKNKRIVMKLNNNKESGSKQPDFELFLLVTPKEKEAFEIKVGAAWINENGEFDISFQNTRDVNGKTYSGYSLVKDTEVDASNGTAPVAAAPKPLNDDFEDIV